MLKLRLPKLVALGAFALGVFSTAYADITPLRTGPVSQYGQLQAGQNASGKGRIYGNCAAYSTSGNEVQVKGMSLFWSNEQNNNRYWKDDVITGLVQKQGVQLVRAAVAVDDQGWGNGHYFVNGKTEYYQDLLDEVVESAIKNDIYVIIDYHTHTANNNWNRAKEFFKIQAKKWGKYDNVIFEIYNEPICKNGFGDKSGNGCSEYGGWIDMAGIKAYANAIIPIIRRYSDNLIVVGTPRWSGQPGAAVGNAVQDERNNVAYTLHYYGGYTSEGGTHLFDPSSSNLAMNNGLAVFVTEWGAIGYDGGGTVTDQHGSDQNNLDWLNWMDENKLSSANWNAGYNGTEGGATAAEYFRVKFDGIDASAVAWTEDTYSTSAKWVNQHVFAGLAAETYTQCQSYVNLDPVPADDPNFDDSGDDFGDVYEDEVINHDYVIDDFDGNKAGTTYEYAFTSIGQEGDWTWTVENSGVIFKDGSFTLGLEGVAANDGGGWAGLGVHVENLKGCNVLSFRHLGLAADFSIALEAGGAPLVNTVFGSTDGWMTQSISLDGIDPVVLESPIKIQWQVSGSPSGEDLYIDDVVCGDPASGSNDPLVPPYMIDDFETVDDGYAWPYMFANGTTTVANDENEYGYIVRFPGAAAPGSDYGIGLVGVTTTGDGWADAVLVKEVSGLSSGCSVISYQYKGGAHFFKAVDPALDVDAIDHDVHRMSVGGSDSWKTVWIDVSELRQWGHNDVLDLSKVTSLRWEMNNDKGSSNLTNVDLFVDNVRCAAEDEAREYVIDDFDGNKVSTSNFAIVHTWEDGENGPTTIGNTLKGSEDNYQVIFADVGSGNSNASGIVDLSGPSGATLGMELPGIKGCKAIQYKYKGAAHKFMPVMNDDKGCGMSGCNFHKKEIGSPSDDWKTEVVLVSELAQDDGWGTQVSLDPSTVAELRWDIEYDVDHNYIYVDDVECVIPAEKPPVELHEFLVSDFDGNGTALYSYVFEYGETSTGNDCDDENGCSIVVLQVAAYAGDYGAALVGISSTAPTSNDPGDGAAVLNVHVPGLEGCKTLKYAYKGAGHTVMLRYNEDDSWTYEVNDAMARTEWKTKMVSVEGYDSPEEITDIRFRVLGQPAPDYLYVDDIECVLEEPAVELPEPKAPTTYTALVEDFEDGDYYPLWPVGNWWIDYAGSKTGTSRKFVKGSQSSTALQVNFTLDKSGIDYDPYTAISSNNFDDLNLSNCTEVRYDYKGAAHKFRIKFSGQINDLLHLDWNFHAFAVESRSESWQTVSIPLSSLRQQYCDENECNWGSYIPLDTIMRRVNGFDWRVDGADGVEDSLAIDNIRCVGLAETPYYTATFKNGDGSIMETQTWAENSNMYFPNLAPTKEPTAQYEYLFTGWSSNLVDEDYEPVKVTGDAVYTPIFTENLRYYEITFLKDDGDQINSDFYAYGTRVAAFSPSAPAKAADDSCTYAFNGWDPSFDSETLVEEAVTYRATYEPTLKSFNITFKDDDGTLLAVVSEVYGTLADDINAPDVQAAAGKKFAGWTPGLTRVTGEAEYTAQYTDKFIITWKDYNGDVLRTDFLDAGETPSFGTAPTRAATAEYTYTFKGWNPSVVDVTGDAIYTATYDSTKNKYDVVFYDEDGTTPLAALTAGPYEYGTLVSSIAPTPTKAATAEYTYTFAGWSPAVTNATAVTDDASYTAVYTETVNTYTITFVWDDGITEYATVTRDYGTEISTMLPKVDPNKAPDAQYTYEFEKWVALDGSDVDVDAWLETNMTLKAKFQQFVRKYTVTFLNYNSDVLKSGLYEYGTEASVVVPTENPTRPDDGSYRYTFNGWDSDVTDVTGAAIYTAIYTPTVFVHYAAVTVEEVDGKMVATIDGAFTDPDGVNIPTSIEVDTVVFNRTFSASGYSTIMLPFSINRSAIEGVSKVLTFAGIGYDENGKKQVEMEEVNGELSAYKPYMVELASEGSLVFHGNSTVIQPTEGANTAVQSGDGWEFRGTLNKIVWNESHPDLGRVYGFSGKETDKIQIGQFVKAAAGAWIMPFRAYLIYNDGKSAGKSAGRAYVSAEPLPDYMDVVVVSRGATGEESKTVIGGINTRTGEFKMLQNYDLKGRKLNGKPTARGVYYGKKKIIK